MHGELALPDGFEETRFERGPYGPDDRRGFEAVVEQGTMALAVLPVRYERRDGTETITGLTGEFEAEREDLSGRPDVAPTTAFALRARFQPYEAERERLVTLAADAGDALAAAVWLARESDDDGALERNLELHWGTQSPSRGRPALSDDDVLGALFADEPERCVIQGKETSSHRIEVPYRYASLFSGMRRTDRGVVRFPGTVARLVAMVSHAAWEEHDLDGVDFDVPLEREGPGEYRLQPAAAEALADAEAERFALRRLGE